MGGTPCMMLLFQRVWQKFCPGEAVTVYRTLCNSLIHAFYAERASINIGCGYAMYWQK